jgi:hypothetical protein
VIADAAKVAAEQALTTATEVQVRADQLAAELARQRLAQSPAHSRGAGGADVHGSAQVDSGTAAILAQETARAAEIVAHMTALTAADLAATASSLADATAAQVLRTAAALQAVADAAAQAIMATAAEAVDIVAGRSNALRVQGGT